MEAKEAKSKSEDNSISINKDRAFSDDIAPKRNGLNALLILLVAVILGVGIWFITNPKNKKSNDEVPPPAQIQITSNGFIPATVTVVKNQSVVWTNTDSAPHEVAADPYPTNNSVLGLNEQQPLPKGTTYDFIFTNTGEFTYHDNLNPYKFHGKIIVKT